MSAQQQRLQKRNDSKNATTPRTTSSAPPLDSAPVTETPNKQNDGEAVTANAVALFGLPGPPAPLIHAGRGAGTMAGTAMIESTVLIMRYDAEHSLNIPQSLMCNDSLIPASRPRTHEHAHYRVLRRCRLF